MISKSLGAFELLEVFVKSHSYYTTYIVTSTPVTAPGWLPYQPHSAWIRLTPTIGGRWLTQLHNTGALITLHLTACPKEWSFGSDPYNTRTDSSTSITLGDVKYRQAANQAACSLLVFWWNWFINQLRVQMGCLAGPCKWKLVLPAMNNTHWAKKQTVSPKTMKRKYLIMTSHLKLRGKIQHKTRIVDSSSRSTSINSCSVLITEHF